ncbi:MAG TPA: hypothetical protein PLU37_15235, partial [Chitinophagaceae bacterium]|nr:hypothetical protein [Chitinophagaceae bacterium]
GTDPVHISLVLFLGGKRLSSESLSAFCATLFVRRVSEKKIKPMTFCISQITEILLFYKSKKAIPFWGNALQ